MSLRIKAWILSAQIFIGLLGITLIGLFTVRYSSNQDNAARVEQLLNSTYATVIQIEQMAARSELDDETAKKSPPPCCAITFITSQNTFT